MKKIPALILFTFLSYTLKCHAQQCLSVNIGIVIDTIVSPCDGPIILDAHHTDAEYKWNTGEITKQITITTSDTFIVEVNKQGCTGTDTIYVSLLDKPQLMVSADTHSVCGECITIYAATDASNIAWSTGGQGTDTKVCTPGQQYITAQVTSAKGCTSKDSVLINIEEGTAFSLGHDIITCEGEVVLEGPDAAEYLWNTGQKTSTITTDTAGIYWLQIKDDNGCLSSDTILVTYAEQMSLPLDDTLSCNACIELDAGYDAETILWSTGERTRSINYCTPGENQVWVFLENEHGCAATDTFFVTLKQVEDISLGPDVRQCGGTVNLTTGHSSSHLWNTGETVSNITVDTSGTYIVKVFDLEGCSKFDTLSASVQVDIVNTLDTPEQIVITTTDCYIHDLSVVPVAGADTYSWTLPDGWEIVSGTGTNNIIAKASENSNSGLISVSPESINGCSGSARDTTVNFASGQLFIPNTFSPNNDGINDTWQIGNIELYPENTVVVLNRWGNEVFRENSYNSGWSGSNLNEGTYFYQITVMECGTQRVYTGNVNIIR